MKNKRLFLLPASIAAGFSLLAPSLHAAAITWDAGGGADKNWSTAANWNPDDSDVSGDAVTFGLGGAAATGVTTNTVSASASIASLTYNQESATLQHTTSIAAGQTLTVTGNFLLAGSTGATTATNVTLTGATGTLTVGGTSFQVGQTAPVAGSSANNLLDMSGLGTFNANLNTTTGVFRLGGTNGATAGSLATVKLAATSTITANALGLGDRAGRSGLQVLKLGSVANIINANTISIGASGSGGRGNGEMSFETSTGTLKLRAADGIAAVTTMNLVNSAFGTANNVAGTANFASHDVDAKITTLNMARRTFASTSNAASATATFTFDTGNLEVTTLNLADNAHNASTSGTILATMNIGGGTASFGAINMAASTGLAGTSTTGTLNLTGGTTTLTGDIIKVGGGTGTTTANLNLNGATLDMTGKNLTSLTTITYTNGLLKNLGIVNTGMTLAGTGSRVFEQGTSISGQIQGAITGTGLGLTKQGVGTLNLAGANTYDGQTAITAGRLQFAKQASLYNNVTGSWTAANINVQSGATIAFNVGGTDEFTASNVTTLLTNLADSSGATNGMNAGSAIGFDTTNASGGTFTIADVIADTTGAGGGSRGFTKLGTNTLVLTNDNTFTGNITIATGELRITKASALGSGTKTINAQNPGYLTLDGTAANISLASNFSFTTAGLSILNAAGDNVINGTVKTIAGNGTSRITSDGGSLTLAGNIDSGATGNRILELSGTSTGANTVSGSISNGTATVAITKSGAGTWSIANGANAYTGATNVNAGTLAVTATGSINTSSGVNINGGTLRYNASTNLSPTVTFTSGAIAGTNWNGSLSGQTIGTGKTISPGNSPGTAATVAQTWASGGSYLWEINNVTGTAGVDPGWDLLSGTGTLDITATSGSEFNLLLTSLTTLNAAGNAVNFSDLASYNWLIADFTSITGFDATDFNINTSAFANTFTGAFGVSLGGVGAVPGDSSQIYLTYIPVPEPRAALLGGLGLLALLRRRRSC